MYKANRTKNPFIKQMIANTVYVIIALLIVATGVYSLIMGAPGRALYPVIFILAAALNFTDGIPRIISAGRDKRKKAGGIALCVLGLLLIGIAALIGYTVWL